MTAICVDDEELVMQLVVSLLEIQPDITEAVGFTASAKALAWLGGNNAELAVLDIDMPGMSGIELAQKIKKISPGTEIIFLTGYVQYVIESFKLHASGYILKPVDPEQLAAEVKHALSGMRREAAQNTAKHTEEKPRVTARTFGEFAVTVDGEPVRFHRAQTKELLAYLIDRHGCAIKRAAIYAALWEDGLYDRSKQKQLDVIIRDLRATLSEYGAGDIIEMQSGSLRICPEKLDCDLFRLLDGDNGVVNECRGEYMKGYSWAGLDETYINSVSKTK